MEVYNITELSRVAIGEKPPHRIKEIKSRLTGNIITKIGENPESLKQRYAIKNGEIELFNLP